MVIVLWVKAIISIFLLSRKCSTLATGLTKFNRQSMLNVDTTQFLKLIHQLLRYDECGQYFNRRSEGFVGLSAVA